jgi:uncharacterized membrane protein YhaH (DUF805 family)
MLAMSDSAPATNAHCCHCGAETQSDAFYCWQCGQARSIPASQATSASPQLVPETVLPSDSAGGWRRLFSTQGRIGRLEFFLTIVAIWAVMLVALEFSQRMNGYSDVQYLLAVLVFFGAFFVTTALSVLAGWKRLQDFDRQGWLVLLSFIPLFGTVLVPLVLLVAPPSQGANTFGSPNSGSPFPRRTR